MNKKTLGIIGAALIAVISAVVLLTPTSKDDLIWQTIEPHVKAYIESLEEGE